MTPSQCAVDLIRHALTTSRSGDPDGLQRAVRHHLDDLPRSERNRIVGALALVAASLAGSLPAEQREEILTRWQGSHQELAAAALALLLATAAGR